jgi:acyl-[acyl-carrier-protein] desaturase
VQYQLSPALEGRMAALLARHKEASIRTDWSYHAYLPIERYHAGRQNQPLSTLAYTAAETALLTEVNLPWYTSALWASFKDTTDSMREFIHLWTAEEDQHSMLLETYLLLTDNGDHAARGKKRKSILAGGWEHELDGPFEGIVYTTIQETQTRAFYIRAARAIEGEDPALAAALRRISADETLHMAFYRDAVRAHLEADADYLVPVARVFKRFQMPGTVMSDYEARHAYLSKRVFGAAEFAHDVVEPLCVYWNLASIPARSEEAHQAQRTLVTYRKVVRMLAERGTRRELAAFMASAKG